MYTGSGKDIAITMQLDSMVNSLDNKISLSKANREKVETLKKSIASDKRTLDIVYKILPELKDLITKTTQYLNDKKTKGLNAVRKSIYDMRNIIQDSANLQLIVDGNDSYICDSDGYNVAKLEGSAFRSGLGLLIKNRFLVVGNYIMTAFYDEGIATADTETSVLVSKNLYGLSLYTPMVLIEQKDAVFETIEHTAYSFRKSEGRTTARRDG